MKPSNLGLLGIAFCFYFIGGAVFDSLGSFVPFLCSIDMLIVGLFLGLLPRVEKFLLFGVCAVIDISQVIINVPYREAEFSNIFNGFSMFYNNPQSYSGFAVPPWITSVILLASLAFLGFLAIKFLKEIFGLLKSGKTLLLFALFSFFITILSALIIFQPFMATPNILFSDPLTMSSLTVKFLTFIDFYIIFTSPVFGYYFFKWLKIYNRIPRVYGNS